MPHLEVSVPGDKSLSHRALMFAALARGTSSIGGVLDSDDVQSTAACLRQLGVTIPPLATSMRVTGGGVPALKDPAADLDCGNSGTTARLLAGIVAGAGRNARFVGDASLSRRPMRRIAEPLELMGARLEFERGEGLPMRVIGAGLRAIEYASPSSSAQVKSAILLAAFSSRVAATVREQHRSRDHTERMLAALGVPVSVGKDVVEMHAARDDLPAFDFEVPGDPSSFAFFAGWAALTGTPVVSNTISVNPTRTGFLDALSRAGTTVETEGLESRCGEPVGRVAVTSRVRDPFVITGVDVPSMVDELPLTGCMAACIDGESRVTGARELRVKESDRIAVLVKNLRQIGADAEELTDGFVVRGSRRPLRGTIETHGDHRIAMAFGVLAALPENDIAIDDPDCAAVSYPGFWTAMRRLATE